MSTYCYTTEDGTVTEEHIFPIGTAPATITTKNGSVAHRDMYAEMVGTSQKSGDPWTNHASVSLMVNPTEREKYTKEAAELGVPTQFNEAGMPMFTSASHRKRYNKAYGFVDLNSYY